MRKLFLVATALSLLAVPAIAQQAAPLPAFSAAEVGQWLAPSSDDPTRVGGLGLKAMNKSINVEALTGQPITAVYNTTDDDITGISCGSTHIVGAGSDGTKHNPNSIKAHGVALINFKNGMISDACAGVSPSFTTDNGDILTAEGNVKGDLNASTKIVVRAGR